MIVNKEWIVLFVLRSPLMYSVYLRTHHPLRAVQTKSAVAQKKNKFNIIHVIKALGCVVL